MVGSCDRTAGALRGGADLPAAWRHRRHRRLAPRGVEPPRGGGPSDRGGRAHRRGLPDRRPAGPRGHRRHHRNRGGARAGHRPARGARVARGGERGGGGHGPGARRKGGHPQVHRPDRPRRDAGRAAVRGAVAGRSSAAPGAPERTTLGDSASIALGHRPALLRDQLRRLHRAPRPGRCEGLPGDGCAGRSGVLHRRHPGVLPPESERTGQLDRAGRRHRGGIDGAHSADPRVHARAQPGLAGPGGGRARWPGGC